MAKYLDKSGVTYLWNKIKGLFTDQSLNTKNKTYAGAINEINTKVGNLTGAFLWKGKFDTLPAVTNYEAGNVVGVGKKEYVLTVTGSTKTWEEFGDEGSYLLKTTAEETYLKKAAGEVKTANLADNVVTSTKLATGARRPIIITGDMTEVDENTYQKLLSDDVDVVFKTIDGNLCILTYKYDAGEAWNFYFTCFSFEGYTIDIAFIYAYEVHITKNSPHTCYITENINTNLQSFINGSGYLNKSTLSPILQEIDLTGTDAERKAKLDQFETDWKALTGAGDLTGARFVGRVDVNQRIFKGLLSFNSARDFYSGIAVRSDDSYEHLSISVTTEGYLEVTPLFSHLEAITIYTDNTPEHMQANLDNIAAYEANLQALGVDTTKSPMIPCGFQNNSRGWITKSSTASGGSGHLYVGIARDENGAPYTYFMSINPMGGYSKVDAINSGYINNNFELGVVGVQANAKSLEAVAIKTGNTPDDKAANAAAIKAYVDNLTALGVDVTKGFMIPIKTNFGNGFILFDGTKGEGYVKLNNDCYGILIDANYAVAVNNLISTITNYSSLDTTSKRVLPAINEVNALAKGKQDKLTSGTNIKTVNGQSLLGSGDIAISGGGSGDVTKAGNNIFTGDNTFTKFVHFSRGIELTNANDDVHYYLDLDSNTNKFRISDDSDMDVEVTGVDTPTQDNAAANKKYVDDKVAAAGGVANKLTVTNFDSNSGRPINIQDTDLNDVLYVENNVGISYDGPMLTIKKCDNGSGSASQDAYVTNICGKGIEIGSAANGDYDYGTVISKGEILLYGSPVITIETLKNELPIGTKSISSTTTETIKLVSSTTSAHRIILANPSGTKTILLPANPYDGETFEIIRIEGVSFILTNNSGKAMQKCTETTTVTSMNISSSGKYTCIYSSSVNRWYVMRDDFVSF